MRKRHGSVPHMFFAPISDVTYTTHLKQFILIYGNAVSNEAHARENPYQQANQPAG